MTTTIGVFTYDHHTERITGPDGYMEERFDGRMSRIYAGQDSVFNFGSREGQRDSVSLVLVSLQTDYASWLGMKTFGPQSDDSNETVPPVFNKDGEEMDEGYVETVECLRCEGTGIFCKATYHHPQEDCDDCQGTGEVPESGVVS